MCQERFVGEKFGSVWVVGKDKAFGREKSGVVDIGMFGWFAGAHPCHKRTVYGFE